MGGGNSHAWSGTACVGSILIAGLVATIGCGEKAGSRRHAVRGSVMFRGKPVPSGEVTFEPDSRAGNKGPASWGEITDGRYAIGRAKGHIGGAYVIRVSGYGSESVETPDGSAPVTLFQEHVQACELPRGDAVHDIDVVLRSPATR
jgi:hypothetical protein